MAVCNDCEREMTTAASCVVRVLVFEGQAYERRAAGPRDLGPQGRCGDCGVTEGGLHHYGCDLEDCPSCGWQLLSCACGRDEDADERHVLLLP
jgi:hypothetical protein